MKNHANADRQVTTTVSSGNKAMIRLLNEALAAELVCVLRDKRQQVITTGATTDSFPASHLSAGEKTFHLHSLAKLIIGLGGEPYFSTDMVGMPSQPANIEAGQLN